MNYDLVIVGAGCAGSIIAEQVAKEGYSVAVLEKQKEIGYPNYSTAGVSYKRMQPFNLPEETIDYSVSQVSFNTISGEREVFDFDDTILVTLNFRELRQHLATKAIEAGADIFLDTAVKKPIIEGGNVVGVTTEDESFSGKIVADCAGAHGIIRRAVGLKPADRLGVAKEYMIYTGENKLEISIFIGDLIPAGFAWDVPLGKNMVHTGMGYIPEISGKIKLEERLDKFIDHLGYDKQKSIEKHVGSYYTGGNPGGFCDDGVILIGDAASQAGPPLALGIIEAMQGAMVASKTVIKALSSDNTSKKVLKEYEKNWKKEYGTNYKIGREVARIFATASEKQIVKLIRVLAEIHKKDPDLTYRFIIGDYKKSDLLSFVPKLTKMI